MRAPHVDVLVRGAGPVGCAAALALRAAGLRVALLEGPSAAPAFRPISLSYASRLILERLGAWSALEATPIETILVSQAGSFGRTRLQAADAGVPALGYVAEYSSVLEALRARVAALLTGEAPSAACTVHAEGSAPGEGKRYAQDALVALVEHEPAATSSAFERFTDEGPLALLPLAGRHAVVWSMRPERAARLAAASADEFLASLAACAGSAAGRPRAVLSRSVQPLSLKVRPARVEGSEVYIGNAAQTLHPVAGQGLNLGLRDAWDLAASLAERPGPEALARYARRRTLDAQATIRVTDALAAGFTGARGPLRALRGAALTALDLFPAPRRFFARRMIFGAQALP
jgi:2-octaprenyl-6-methoxyphenol hydroxylase